MIKFLGVIAFTWLFVEGATPIQFIKDWFEVGGDSTPKNFLKRYIIQPLLNCALCMGFWIGLMFYFNEPNTFYLACIISLCAEAFYKIVKKLGTYFLEV